MKIICSNILSHRKKYLGQGHVSTKYEVQQTCTLPNTVQQTCTTELRRIIAAVKIVKYSWSPTFIKSKTSEENFGNFFSSGSTSLTSGSRMPAKRGFRWKISRCLGQRFPEMNQNLALRQNEKI